MEPTMEAEYEHEDINEHRFEEEHKLSISKLNEMRKSKTLMGQQESNNKLKRISGLT